MHVQQFSEMMADMLPQFTDLSALPGSCCPDTFDQIRWLAKTC